MSLVGVARRAGKLAEVEAKPERVDESPIHLHAAVVTEVVLLEHRLLHLPIKYKISIAQTTEILVSGCGRVVTSDSRGPGFQSSLMQFL